MYPTSSGGAVPLEGKYLEASKGPSRRNDDGDDGDGGAGKPTPLFKLALGKETPLASWNDP